MLWIDIYLARNSKWLWILWEISYDKWPEYEKDRMFMFENNVRGEKMFSL